MSTIAKITLLFVVFVDLIGQGLVFPIINSRIMESTGHFLRKSAPQAIRHVDYGLVIGSFFSPGSWASSTSPSSRTRSDARTRCWSASAALSSGTS